MIFQRGRASQGKRRGDLFMFGGAGIAQSFVAQDLIDEYRMMVTPNLFGDGKRSLRRIHAARSGIDRERPLDTGAGHPALSAR